MHGMKTIAFTALAALAVVAAIALPAHGDSVPVAERGVVATGTGTATAVPDRGSFTFTVATPAKTAVAATQANAAGMRAVVAALKAAGIAAADLQTTQLSLDQQQSPDGQTVAGYTATSSVTAQLRDLARAGAVVDAAVAA